MYIGVGLMAIGVLLYIPQLLPCKIPKLLDDLSCIAPGIAFIGSVVLLYTTLSIGL